MNERVKRFFIYSSVYIGLFFSAWYQYIIIRAYETGFRVILDFNSVGEGYFEMLILIPMSVLLTGVGVYVVEKESWSRKHGNRNKSSKGGGRVQTMKSFHKDRYL